MEIFWVKSTEICFERTVLFELNEGLRWIILIESFIAICTKADPK